MQGYGILQTAICQRCAGYGNNLPCWSSISQASSYVFPRRFGPRMGRMSAIAVCVQSRSKRESARRVCGWLPNHFPVPKSGGWMVWLVQIYIRVHKFLLVQVKIFNKQAPFIYALSYSRCKSMCVTRLLPKRATCLLLRTIRRSSLEWWRIFPGCQTHIVATKGLSLPSKKIWDMLVFVFPERHVFKVGIRMTRNYECSR